MHSTVKFNSALDRSELSVSQPTAVRTMSPFVLYSTRGTRKDPSVGLDALEEMKSFVPAGNRKTVPWWSTL